MKEFWKILKRYAWPYKGWLGGSVVLNILSAVFNIFSFSLLIPILKILFNISEMQYEFIPWDTPGGDFTNIAVNNLYYFVTGLMQQWGASKVLLVLCLALSAITAVKTACYFGASAVMVPIRTGIVKDLRMDLYRKIVSLPLGYFSQERKGDIIARMSGDVQEVENSVASSLDMLIKNPILIIFYIGALIAISWQLTVFVIVFAPVMLWLMGLIGRKLKRQSTEAQALWSDTMSQVEETLGGLRVIKAFLAEKKMEKRFDGVTGAMKRKSGRVATRQVLAHPVSEFLGTVMIAIVLWFGGTLIIGDRSVIDAPTFIFYMVMLYSVIQPIKDFSKAAYGIPKGLASMERIDAILNAENPITEPANPVALNGFNDKIVFRGVGFRYEDGKEVRLERSRIVEPLEGVSESLARAIVNLGLELPEVRTLEGVGICGGRSYDVRVFDNQRTHDAGRVVVALAGAHARGDDAVTRGKCVGAAERCGNCGARGGHQLAMDVARLQDESLCGDDVRNRRDRNGKDAVL